MSDGPERLPSRHPVFGYWFFDPPADDVLREHYERRYFQANEIYASDWSAEEVGFFRAAARRKVELINRHVGAPLAGLRCLEIGVGEGWSMAALQEAGAAVEGIDYSSHGLDKWNPSLKPAFTACDPQPELARRVAEGRRYDLIWLDNVLEHVPRPEATLDLLSNAVAPGGWLLVEVPNDESALQHFLLENGLIDRRFWLAYPEHLSYFSRESLGALCASRGFTVADAIADFPIDLFLLNDSSNYVRDRSVGKAAHHARVRFERLLASRGVDAELAWCRALADAQLGRNLTALFRREGD